MRKTTLYLPDPLKRRLEQLARREGRSEAELMRWALERLVDATRPRPRPALFRSGDPTLARHVDEALTHFGE